MFVHVFSRLHVLFLLIVVSCSLPADVEVDSTVVLESPLLSCALACVSLPLLHFFSGRPSNTPLVIVVFEFVV